jgi:hypothetical protein
MTSAGQFRKTVALSLSKGDARDSLPGDQALGLPAAIKRLAFPVEG